VHADQQFISELLNIMAIEHENILKLLSYCSEAQKKVVLHNNKYIIADTTECILCYEYASKGSIEKYIFGMEFTMLHISLSSFCFFFYGYAIWHILT